MQKMSEKETILFLNNAVIESKKILEELKNVKNQAERAERVGEYYSHLENCEKEIESCRVAIQALEEIQQYRAIETELKERYHANVDIKMLMQYFIETIFEGEKHEGFRILTNEDAKMWDAYKAIGTVEEIKAFKERIGGNDMERLTERELYDGKVCYTKCAATNCPDKCSMCSIPKEAAAKLKEYEDLEEQGLLFRLSCKVGDTVYIPKYYLDCEYDYHCPLSCVNGKNDCEKGFCCEHEHKKYFIREDVFNIKMLGDIGKTIFTTKAEAEVALEKMKGEEYE